jgi:hypothetical protein
MCAYCIGLRRVQACADLPTTNDGCQPSQRQPQACVTRTVYTRLANQLGARGGRRRVALTVENMGTNLEVVNMISFTLKRTGETLLVDARI